MNDSDDKLKPVLNYQSKKEDEGQRRRRLLSENLLVLAWIASPMLLLIGVIFRSWQAVGLSLLQFGVLIVGSCARRMAVKLATTILAWLIILGVILAFIATTCGSIGR